MPRRNGANYIDVLTISTHPKVRQAARFAKSSCQRRSEADRSQEGACIDGKLPQFRLKSPRDLKTITPCRAVRGYQLKNVMMDILEKRLIEALERVEAHGDVAPVHVHDPMTMLLRENAIQAHLMRWDDARGRYVLTGTGRRRISAGGRVPGTVVSFRRRGVVNTGAPQRKPANANLKE